VVEHVQMLHSDTGAPFMSPDTPSKSRVWRVFAARFSDVLMNRAERFEKSVVFSAQSRACLTRLRANL